MSEQKQSKDHIVVTISVKRVTFEPLAQGGPRTSSTAMNVNTERRVVGDVLQASVTGSTVEQARNRALIVMGSIDDESPSTNLKHESMRGNE